MTERELGQLNDKDKQIQDLTAHNQELGNIIDSMAADIQQLRTLSARHNLENQGQEPLSSQHLTPPLNNPSGPATPEMSGSQTLFDLRRENFNLIADNRRLELENQVLKASGDGGEQRMRERQHYEEQLVQKDTHLTQLKDRLLHKEQETSQLLSRTANLDAQISSLKAERDRLLEVSKNLRIQLNKLEKQQVFNSIKLSDGGHGESKQSLHLETEKKESKLLQFSDSVNKRQQ